MSLKSEMRAARNALDIRYQTWLREHGVSDSAIMGWPGPMGCSCIETHPMGMFDFSETGYRAFIQPILSGPDIIDLVAWFPSRPERWWTRRYSGNPLGIDQLDRAEIEGEPVLLHRTPLDRLRADGDGVVALDWKMTANQLRNIPVIITGDPDFGHEVRQRLTQPNMPCPEIRVLAREAA